MYFAKRKGEGLELFSGRMTGMLLRTLSSAYARDRRISWRAVANRDEFIWGN